MCVHRLELAMSGKQKAELVWQRRDGTIVTKRGYKGLVEKTPRKGRNARKRIARRIAYDG